MSTGPDPGPGPARTGGGVASRAPDPDRTARHLRCRPIVGGMAGLAVLAGAVGLLTESAALGMLMLAVAGVVAFDALSARSALARVRPTVASPLDSLAGQPALHVVQAHDLVQPVELVRPAWWATPTRASVALRSTLPGTVVMDAPGRSVVDHMVFDLVAPGPLGLVDAACRVRVRLPVPWAIGPVPLPHDLRWPPVRTVPPGESSTLTRGDDLFRGVRPYTRGDTRRSVHWPATAHRGALMVKERDGIEQVALRVVLHLVGPGPASEAAAGRAAWLVAHGLSRGWRVHLVTAEVPPAAWPPLLQPWGPTGAPLPSGPATGTVDRQVDRTDQARHQLAAAGYGPPLLGRWTGLTRVVSSDGDGWR